MGRPSNRAERRDEILAAFARVLGRHGYAGATISAVAEAAGYAPGLVHHHFESKQELLDCLATRLIQGFRSRVSRREDEAEPREALHAYIDAALALDARADVTSARCWVGVFAEALRAPTLFDRVRRLVDTELVAIRRRSGNRLTDQEAGAVLAFIVGALVLGAFAPRKTAGFAAPSLHRFVEVLLSAE